MQNRRRPAEGSHACLDRQGRVHVCPEYFPLLQHRNTADPYDVDQYTTPQNARSWRFRVEHSRRFAQPTRWEIDPGTGAFEDLMTRAANGGTEFACNERLWENRFGAGQVAINPTFGGFAMSTAVGRVGVDVNAVMPSPPVHFHNWQNGVEVVLESAVIPLDFDTYGLELPENAKGGDGFTPGIHFRARQYQRNTFNFGGVANLHHLFFAAYYPQPIDAHETPAQHTLTAGIYLLDLFGQPGTDAWYCNPRRLDPGFVGANTFRIAARGSGDDFEVTDRVSWTCDHNARLFTSELPGPVTASYGESIIDSSGQVAVVLFTPALPGGQPFYFAVAAKLGRDTRESQVPNKLIAAQIRDGAHPAPGVDVISGQVVYLQSASLLSRAPGWIGLQCWFVTESSQADLQQTLSIASKRFMDQPLPWHWIPDHVIASTELPGDLRRQRGARRY